VWEAHDLSILCIEIDITDSETRSNLLHRGAIISRVIEGEMTSLKWVIDQFEYCIEAVLLP
jgi:hypothetical protein